MKPPFDPMLIRLSPTFGIYWYGVLIVTGILLGAIYAAWRAKQDGENPEHVWNGLIAVVLVGIVGARIYHVLSEPSGGAVGWSYYREHPIEALYIWRGGLGIYGAVAGGVLGALIYIWRFKLRPLQWLDYAAPGLALGQAIGRWGNFINQELYGPPTHSTTWGLLIDPEHRIVPYNDLTAYPLDTLFHPTFLYESLWCLTLFITLALIGWKLRKRLLAGDIFLGYVIGYPLGRFFIEYFRPDAWMLGPIAAAQLFAVICVLFGVAMLVMIHLRARRLAPAQVGPATVESGPPTEAD